MQAFNNELDVLIDYEALNQQFEFYQIEFDSDSKSKRYASRADLINHNKDFLYIEAVKFSYGQKLYLMTKKDAEDQVRDLLDNLDARIKIISWQQVAPADLEQSIVVQLLINNVSIYFDKTNGPMTNLSGHAYYFKKFATKKKKRIKKDNKAVALEFKVTGTKACYLNMSVRTFSSRENVFKFKQGQTFDSFPKYKQVGDRLIYKRQQNKQDDGDFIKRTAINAQKSIIPFYDLKLDKFPETKVGYLKHVIDEFNFMHAGYAEIKGFKPFSFTKVGQIPTKLDENKRIAELLAETDIQIQDLTKNLTTKQLASLSRELKIKVKSNTYAHFDFEILPPNQKPTKPCLRIVYNKDYYQRENLLDPHQEQLAVAVQHITYQDFVQKIFKTDDKGRMVVSKERDVSTIRTALTNLLIKNDVLERKVRVFDSVPAGEWTYYYTVKIDGKKPTYYVTLNEGQLSFGKVDLVDLPKLAPYFNELVAGGGRFLVVHDGKFALVKDTGRFIMPDYADAVRQFEAGKAIATRSNVAKENALASLLELNQVSGKNQYFVGMLAQELNTKWANAIHIYELSGDLEAKDLLAQMDNLIVKNLQLAVVPFPIKYLREYLELEVFK